MSSFLMLIVFIIRAPSLNHFGSQGQDLHVILVAQLAGHWPKDTGTAGVVVVLDQNSGVLIEADIGAVSTTDATCAVRTITALTTSPFLT